MAYNLRRLSPDWAMRLLKTGGVSVKDFVRDMAHRQREEEAKKDQRLKLERDLYKVLEKRADENRRLRGLGG